MAVSTETVKMAFGVAKVVTGKAGYGRKPWKFIKIRTRLVVRDADGNGPLFILESGYIPEAVAMMERAINAPAECPTKFNCKEKP